MLLVPPHDSSPSYARALRSWVDTVFDASGLDDVARTVGALRASSHDIRLSRDDALMHMSRITGALASARMMLHRPPIDLSAGPRATATSDRHRRPDHNRTASVSIEGLGLSPFQSGTTLVLEGIRYPSIAVAVCAVLAHPRNLHGRFSVVQELSTTTTRAEDIRSRLNGYRVRPMVAEKLLAFFYEHLLWNDTALRYRLLEIETSRPLVHSLMCDMGAFASSQTIVRVLEGLRDRCRQQHAHAARTAPSRKRARILECDDAESISKRMCDELVVFE